MLYFFAVLSKALILLSVIGTVVDDAIVVVEAVQARFDVGYRSSYMGILSVVRMDVVIC